MSSKGLAEVVTEEEAKAIARSVGKTLSMRAPMNWLGGS